MLEFILTRVLDFTKELRPVNTEYADAEEIEMKKTTSIANFVFFKHAEDVKTALVGLSSVTAMLT